MKKTWLILIGILWILAGVQFVESYETDKADKIIEVLGKVGSMERFAIVECEGILLEKIEKSKVVLEKIICELELETVNNTSVFCEESFEEWVYTNKGIIKLVTRTKEEGSGQYIFVKLDYGVDTKNAFAAKKRLEEVIKPYLRGMQSSVNVIGSLKGELSLKQRNLVADELLKEMGAQVVTEHRTMELFTIYAYTPYITEYKLQKNQAVNVNIAMDYNEEEDRTYLYAAVPVIGVEY